MKPDKPTSREKVEHVLESIENIQSFIEPHTLESFLQDKKGINACLYQFTIIGEATFQLEASILEKYPYPWYKVKSFRNFILHEYHAIVMRTIWVAATEFLPELKEVMERILLEEF
jgi:uncharacterized protein with HEPN domain